MTTGWPYLGTSELVRVFAHWSIAVPTCFDETFVAPDGYWYGWTEDRAISLTSLAIDDRGNPVPIDQLLATMPEMPGTPLDRMPAHLQGRAGYGPIEQPAIASSALSGLIVAEGRLLIVTITSDDFGSACATWLSIRHHPTPLAPGGGHSGAAGARNRWAHRT